MEGTISFTSPEGKQYELNSKVATLLVRPHGWHLSQWVRHGAKISENGKPITQEMVRTCVTEQKNKMVGGRRDEAASIFDRLMTDAHFTEFLTLPAYDYID